jgi:hypothetical protein
MPYLLLLYLRTSNLATATRTIRSYDKVWQVRTAENISITGFYSLLPPPPAKQPPAADRRSAAGSLDPQVLIPLACR